MLRSQTRATIEIKSPQDLGAGLLFIAIGLAGLYFGQDLSFGTSRNMGPGYFPAILSGLILLIGVVIALRGVTIEGPPIEEIRLRPLVVLVAAMLFFGYVIQIAGLAVTATLVAIITAYAQPNARKLETVVFAVCLTVFVVIVFVYALGQPLTVWWES